MQFLEFIAYCNSFCLCFRQIAGAFCQLCPGQLQNPAGARFEVWVNKPGSAFTGEQDLTRGLAHNQDGEALCLSLCELAQIHMDQV